MTQGAVAGYDPRADLLKDMERDPEGHFHTTISGDRRLPPWFGSAAGSAGPADIQERVYRFIRDRCESQDPNEYELRHNWYDRQFEFLRWLPDFDYQDVAQKIALVTWTPLTLDIWPDRQGWLPGGEALFDYIWRCFMTSDDRGDSAERLKYLAVKEAWKHVNAMSSMVASASATDAQLEEYEHWLHVADPDGWAESYELAKEMKPFLDEKAEELGIYSNQNL